MPSFGTSIVLADGKATPVNHTFVPETREGKLASWVDQSAAQQVGYYRLTWSRKAPDASSPNNRIEARLVLPVLETIGNSSASGVLPVPSVAYKLEAIVRIIIPEKATLADCKDLRALLYNALNNTDIKSAIENRTDFY